jgi:molybdopterin-guanine dinucleotide biosynthesis protein MobB
LRSVAVLGYSDTGKTTFIEVLTRRAATAGIPTAVVKYSRHPGDFDAPGSDTARFAATPARFVAYRGRDRWFLSAPGGDVQEGADRAPDERAEIPPWLALLGDDVDLLILEGRRRDDSIICLTTGNSQRVDELKFPVEIADIVISASRHSRPRSSRGNTRRWSLAPTMRRRNTFWVYSSRKEETHER